MSSSSHPEGPGSVSRASNVPAGFTGTFTSRYVGTVSCACTRSSAATGRRCWCTSDQESRRMRP